MDSSEYISELLLKHLRGELTPEEEIELIVWRKSSEENELLYQELNDPEKLASMMKDYYKYRDIIWDKITKRIEGDELPPIKPTRGRSMLVIALGLIVLVGIAELIFRYRPGRKASVPQAQVIVAEILPGTDKATLTLADGSKIALDSAKKGQIAVQASTSIEKRDNGTLSYSAIDDRPGNADFNTLSTPRAGQFHLILPDGSGVWLNAESFITYPVSFTGKERRVEILGEAYFEVRHDAGRPFIVRIPGPQNRGAGLRDTTNVEVLGTKFNIMAYQDESFLKTSLVEGSVRVSREGKTLVIKPGEECRVSGNAQAPELVKGSDVERAIAWKNGRIPFTDADIPSIMRALSRWYDVDILYQGKVPEKKLQGGIERNTKLSDVLKVLEAYGIHTKLEGRQLTILQ